ncbi:MAG: helix-turn-helix domain-containing protein [Mycoplasma sp.]|nr:helix-turn-helix domain-containing protein [Mycoplasma sp.]
MAYGLELRQRIIEFIQKGSHVDKAAEIFNINRSTIYRWLKRENLAPKLNHTKGYKIDKKALKKAIEEKPDIFERELAKKFNVSQPSISRMLKKLGYSNKKRA